MSTRENIRLIARTPLVVSCILYQYEWGSTMVEKGLSIWPDMLHVKQHGS